MEEKKRVAILVTIALILAITAIVLNVTDSQEMSTKTPNSYEVKPSQIGLEIQPPQIEDKLNEQNINQ